MMTGTMWAFMAVMLFIMTVAWLMYYLRGRRGPRREQQTPEEILRRRYSAGEIDHEEYQRRKRELG